MWILRTVDSKFGGNLFPASREDERYVFFIDSNKQTNKQAVIYKASVMVVILE